MKIKQPNGDDHKKKKKVTFLEIEVWFFFLELQWWSASRRAHLLTQQLAGCWAAFHHSLEYCGLGFNPSPALTQPP